MYSLTSLVDLSTVDLDVNDLLLGLNDPDLAELDEEGRRLEPSICLFYKHYINGSCYKKKKFKIAI